MIPIDERKETKITSSYSNAKHACKINVVSSVNDFMNYKPIIKIEYKKRKNQMKHFNFKNKKRK